METKRILVAAALLALPAPAGAQSGDVAEPAARPVLVELYTSQGCGACPRANAFLGELAARDDVAALSFSVDYWDYRGWMDTFAQPVFIERQRAYAARLDNRRVYTPQMVIDGAIDASASRQPRVTLAVDERQSALAPGPAITVTWTEDGVAAEVSALETDAPAEVWIVGYTPGPLLVDVEAGDNRGDRVSLYNVARSVTLAGEWTGAEAAFTAPVAAEAVSVIVQGREHGPVLSVVQVERPEWARYETSESGSTVR